MTAPFDDFKAALLAEPAAKPESIALLRQRGRHLRRRRLVLVGCVASVIALTSLVGASALRAIRQQTEVRFEEGAAVVPPADPSGAATDSESALTELEGTLVFVGLRQAYDLFTVDAGGGTPRALTEGEPPEYSPAWSPDGRRVAFHGYARNSKAALDGIYVMNADGTGRRMIADLADGTSESHPTWSPDGRRIAFGHAGSGSIYVVSDDGSDPQRLGRGESPSWSPDGRQIAFSHDLRLYVMATDGSDARLLTKKTPCDDPAWSPDGRVLAFTCYRGNRPDIFAIQSTGGDVKRLVKGGSSQAWSPDGRWLAHSGRGRHIFVTSVDGHDVRQVTNGHGYFSDPDWVSVDG